MSEQGYSVVEACLLGITDKLLYNWVTKHKKDNEAGALSSDERAELNKLRKENKRLQMERKILKNSLH